MSASVVDWVSLDSLMNSEMPFLCALGAVDDSLASTLASGFIREVC